MKTTCSAVEMYQKALPTLLYERPCLVFHNYPHSRILTLIFQRSNKTRCALYVNSGNNMATLRIL